MEGPPYVGTLNAMVVITPLRSQDSWVDNGWDTTEIQFLKKAEQCGIEGIPCVVESKDLMVHEVNNTTNSH
jgi:hypothetical protein